MKIRQVYWHMNEHEHMGVDDYKYCPLCGQPLVEKMIDNRHRRTCSNCGYIHFKNPSPTVSLLIIQDQRVLLGKRKNHPGKGDWATPSGFVEFNEDFLTTAVREVKEETNLDIEITGILDVTDSFFPPLQHFINIYLLAQVTGGQLRAGDDTSDIRWFYLTEPLPDMAFQEDIDLIETYKEQKIKL